MIADDLESFQRTVTRALLASGASIDEINAVRKHLSRIKGGRLAQRAHPARVVTVGISDVPGDDPAVIGSGPTVPDPTTLADARAVLARHRLDVPPPARQALDDQANETPKPDDPIFAYLSAGRGVVVHRENCVNVEDYRKHPENWLPVAWQATSDKLFSSEIRVDVANKMGVLAAVAAAISSGDTNIERVAVEEKDADSSSLVFELRVRNREHLARVVKVIRRMPEVLKVTRTIASHGRSSRSAD